MAEKLIITMELEDIPDGHGLQFFVQYSEDFWFTRFKPFNNWKRITMKAVKITNLDVVKTRKGMEELTLSPDKAWFPSMDEDANPVN